MRNTSGKTALLLVLFLALAASAFAAPVNVALNKPVTLTGTGFSISTNYACPGSGAPAASAVDGVFLPEMTCWQDGVRWGGTDNFVDIALGGTFILHSAIVQADDNDTYELQYLGTDSLYHDWWAIPEVISWGLVTRPDSDQTTQMLLPTVTATGLRFFATGGDGYYAVSEIQAFGNQVPEPGSMILLGTGLAALARAIRRRPLK